MAFWFLSYVIFADSVAPRKFKQGNYNGKSGKKNVQLCKRKKKKKGNSNPPLSFCLLVIQVLSENFPKGFGQILIFFISILPPDMPNGRTAEFWSWSGNFSGNLTKSVAGGGFFFFHFFTKALGEKKNFCPINSLHLRNAGSLFPSLKSL
jgi:hypothetical protein